MVIDATIRKLCHGFGTFVCELSLKQTHTNVKYDYILDQPTVQCCSFKVKVIVLILRKTLSPLAILFIDRIPCNFSQIFSEIIS